MGEGARRIAVAYSGGRDSTALLHATLVQAEPLGIEVVALHVHHGLSLQSDAWLHHCEHQCARWARAGRPVSFDAVRLTGKPMAGDSVEAWARAARYAALRDMAQAHGVDTVLLAHHRRDQAETVLLQLLRGAGTAGLAAMPVTARREDLLWQRPWLAKPREAIEAYVRLHGLEHIDDDSNDDPRHQRNRLRLQLWPALTSAFPQAETALAVSAAWAQEADAALQELAQLDLARCAGPDGLRTADWTTLSSARRSNALRAWLTHHLGHAPPATLTLRLLNELPTLGLARWPVGDGELRLYRGVLAYAGSVASCAAPTVRETALSVRRAGLYALPGWNGSLRVVRVPADGVPLAWLAQVELRDRAGTERFQAGAGRPARSLKKQFQQAAVPEWDRHGPLVYSGGQLVYVPGLGLDARVVGLPGQALAQLHWVGGAVD